MAYCFNDNDPDRPVHFREDIETQNINSYSSATDIYIEIM